MDEPDLPVGFGNGPEGADDGRRLVDDPVAAVGELRLDLAGDLRRGLRSVDGVVVVLLGGEEGAAGVREPEAFAEALEDPVLGRVIGVGELPLPGREAGVDGTRRVGGEFLAGSG